MSSIGALAPAGDIAVGVVVETQILEDGDAVIEGGVADGAVDRVEQVAGRIEGEGLGAGAGGLEDAAGGVVAKGLGAAQLIDAGDEIARGIPTVAALEHGGAGVRPGPLYAPRLCLGERAAVAGETAHGVVIESARQPTLGAVDLAVQRIALDIADRVVGAVR
ncbi:hypothetical protein, partial [Parazoarcus communis]|uniref:hypothetical protein n=2 Tax=Parazoarcus communis TaxID=41977 RepID=UPI001A9F375A